MEPSVNAPASAVLVDSNSDDGLSAARERLVVALDFPSAADALAFTGRLDGSCRWFKVGLELYCAAGNGLIESLRGKGFEVFLDLKLHDIPTTVAGAVRSVAGTGASLLTIHAGGGSAMMQAAAEAAAAVPHAPRLLAVTVLTSMDAAALAGVGVSGSAAEQVIRLARLARVSGIDGMVCSPEEVAALRADLGSDVMLVTPGIRMAGDAVGDQRRIATPESAIALGASKLVVGRPITRAEDPAAAVRAILEQIRRGSAR